MKPDFVNGLLRS